MAASRPKPKHLLTKSTTAWSVDDTRGAWGPTRPASEQPEGGGGRLAQAQSHGLPKPRCPPHDRMSRACTWPTPPPPSTAPTPPPGTGGPSHLGIHLALIPPMHQTRPNTRTYGRAQTGQQNRTRADPGAQRNVRGRPNQPTATHAAPRRPARKAVGGAARSASARQTHLRRASSQGLEPRSACGGEEG